ncbi:MAG: DUF4268 domain-containing protein [Thaumarchaeota archaeon]|jgi:hypothetical protein|nr:DUF4268 domain-containing protein [Candidatus Geocrenenecus arthurdayi]
MSIGRLKRVPVRYVWENEERDFTPWLEENIDVLAEVLGIELSVDKREAKVGERLEVDLLAEGANGERVVIENQFGRSDHEHLGKLLTYMTNYEAKTAIWICEDPQPEHVEAINWLNRNTPSDVGFYLVKLEVFQIGDSAPAPHFSIVSQPSKRAKEAGDKVREIAERHVKRLEFWKQLLERSGKKTDLFSNVSPSRENWIATGAGKSGLKYVYAILMDSARIELYIDREDPDENKKIFDELYKRKQEIEADFSEELEWQRLENRRASRIAKTVINKGLEDIDDWPEIQDRMIDAMIRFEKALRKHINQLP